MANYFLSPRISAKTMEINGGVAFAAALAGSAITGPMGAFMALPVAAWITSFLKHYGHNFYSRLLLITLNGGLFFIAMLLVGVPWMIALPMAVFEGFVAEFIPAIGTCLGAATRD